MFYFQLTGFFENMVIILDSICISLSGEILMVPQKHREASKFIYNSGFYITSNAMLLRLFLFLIYYFFLDWLRLNCMEVFHYVVEKLRVYPLFENGNKSIKINKE